MSRRHVITRAVFRIALRTLKWGTLAAALFVAGVWAGGERTKFRWQMWDSTWDVDIFGLSGRVVVMWDDPTLTPMGFDLQRALLYREMSGTPSRGISPFKNSGHNWSRTWLPRVEQTAPDLGLVSLPYWLPILLFATISGGLFWRDRRAARRARVGMCPSCGYSRAGLALEAVCPECGKPKV